jgi:bla regulator protein BlaR1
MTDLLISLGNHLWQSTLFALCVAGLAVALRGIPARTRFWMWFAGLIKFLVPFSLLLSLGAGLAPKHTGGTQLQPAQFYSVDEVSQPFTYTPPSISIPAKTVLLTHWFPTGRVFMIVAVIWAAGFLSALCFWVLSWQRVKAVMRNASPEPDGMEAEILGRLRERMKVKSEVALLVSDAAMEPGIVGIWRSTLVWPRGISERLSEEQIEAVIAHELAHVSRRDNLTAALAMLGTAIFWFYPLVGWMKARMLDARERACDEAVLLVGHEPEVYASSILRACEFSIESPLACVSGITGSDLKERVRRIMGGNPVRRLSRSAAIVLGAMTAAAILSPVGFGFLDSPRASAALIDDGAVKATFSFEVATIKPTKDPGSGQRSLMMSPGRFWTANIPLREIIMFAYNAKSTSQISGCPDWVASTHYDIEAKEDETASAALVKMPPEERIDQVRLMVQALLAERFQLKVSREMKELPVYALVIAKGGPKLTEATPPPPPPPPPSGTAVAGAPRIGRGFRFAGPGKIDGMNIDLDSFAGGMLSRMPETAGRVVVNKTGLKGIYNFTLRWTPDTSAPGAEGPGGSPPAPTGEDPAPGHFTALEEQLGLKLESQKGSVETLVIDHIELPTPN